MLFLNSASCIGCKSTSTGVSKDDLNSELLLPLLLELVQADDCAQVPMSYDVSFQFYTNLE